VRTRLSLSGSGLDADGKVDVVLGMSKEKPSSPAAALTRVIHDEVEGDLVD
jgi:hypothetical protein